MYQVLIVDDEADIRNGYARFFPWGQQGFEVAGTAADADQALQQLRRRKVDLLLCDIVMPKVDGLCLAESATEEFPDLRIIVLSGHGDFEFARRAIKQNVFAYVLKSDKHEVLIETLARVKAALDAELAGPHVDLPLEAVTRYIQENYASASLRAAAEIAHMSPNYLCKLFKDKTGCNFHSYVINARLSQAKRLLENTDLSVEDVAERVGYTEGKNFIRVFKKVLGLTPKEYKHRNGVSGPSHATPDL